MRVTPVKRKTAPSYPTRNYLDEHPELLLLVPQRWRHNTLALTVLGGVLTLVFAGQSQAAEQKDSGQSSRIAPVFVHGEGRGAFGCVATNPPVFLSEDEAQHVIRDEAKRYGLDFAPGAFTIQHATVPVTQVYWCADTEEEARKNATETQTRDVVLDGYDGAHNVAYEFVSSKLIAAWQHDKCWSSVDYYDLKGTAERLRTGLAAHKPGARIGLFYEPGARKRAIGEKKLREQVRDFIKWLKAQGVI